MWSIWVVRGLKLQLVRCGGSARKNLKTKMKAAFVVLWFDKMKIYFRTSVHFTLAGEEISKMLRPRFKGIHKKALNRCRCYSLHLWYCRYLKENEAQPKTEIKSQFVPKEHTFTTEEQKSEPAMLSQHRIVTKHQKTCYLQTFYRLDGKTARIQ